MYVVQVDPNCRKALIFTIKQLTQINCGVALSSLNHEKVKNAGKISHEEDTFNFLALIRIQLTLALQ